ncbi:hypothetical protein CRG98_025260 [Punica granatum]|uniref:Retrotransposon Copia-like N-terminal domain-containing protein n=1 Tax=Punica granatum TaxID=22663 RepID=A0A2I0JDL7_PUNGR|nr:hypothetical protein CRG98_025260 [Punica granatum]
MMRNEDKAEDSWKGMQLSAIFKIGASDLTGLHITSCLLNGDNYLTWSRVMRIALTAKGKLGFVEGEVPKPPVGDPNLESWEMCNSLVLAWIFNGLEKELQSSVAYATEAKTLWDDLKKRYSQGNEMRIYQLKSEISTYRGGQQKGNQYATTVADQDMSRALVGLSMDNLQMETTEGKGRNREAKGNKPQDGGEDRGNEMEDGWLWLTLHRKGHQRHPVAAPQANPREESNSGLEETLIRVELEETLIRDRISKRTVGLGELRRGVYYLQWVASSTLAYQALAVGSGDI